jgi:hypothetical protein
MDPPTRLALFADLLEFRNEGPRRSSGQALDQFMADNARSLHRLRHLLDRLPVMFEIYAEAPRPAKTVPLKRDGIDLTPPGKLRVVPLDLMARPKVDLPR